MDKFIDVTQNGSNRKLSILIANIYHIEPLTYNRTGETVTVITFADKSTLHVNESVDEVKKIVNAS